MLRGMLGLTLAHDKVSSVTAGAKRELTPLIVVDKSSGQPPTAWSSTLAWDVANYEDWTKAKIGSRCFGRHAELI